MYDWIMLINLSIGVAGLVLSVLGLIMSIFLRPIKTKTRYFFLAIFTLMIFYSLTTILSYQFEMVGNAGGMRWGIFFSSLFSSMLMPVLTVFMLFTCEESWKKSSLFWTVALLWMFYFGLLMTTMFSGSVYSIDDSAVYTRGPLYPLLLVPPVLIMALNLSGLIRRRSLMNKRRRIAFLSYLLLPLLGMLIQMFYYGILTTAVGSLAGILVMFIIMLNDQQDLFLNMAEENAWKELDIRILQMRPHFIYNALSSIYYIVETDPEKAQSVIRDFTIYLRKVFDSVTKREMVSFEEELEHTRAYLSVEQARFEDQLGVTFDIGHKDFSLPPLTLQPVVENAVKHGMDPDREQLNILIRTRAVEGGSEVVIENDGCDLQLEAADAYGGVALRSLEIRLRQMCGGDFSIDPRPGGGTVVTLFIPDQAEKETCCRKSKDVIHGLADECVKSSERILDMY